MATQYFHYIMGYFTPFFLKNISGQVLNNNSLAFGKTSAGIQLFWTTELKTNDNQIGEELFLCKHIFFDIMRYTTQEKEV